MVSGLIKFIHDQVVRPLIEGLSPLVTVHGEMIMCRGLNLWFLFIGTKSHYFFHSAAYPALRRRLSKWTDPNCISEAR